MLSAKITLSIIMIGYASIAFMISTYVQADAPSCRVLHNYLKPADQKVAIQDWHHPTVEDYRALQFYLDHAGRKELKFTNTLDSRWRERRLRSFKIVGDRDPEFHILHLNSASNDVENCIVTYISCNEEYVRFLDRLIAGLQRVGFKGHLIYRIGGWPNTEEGSLEFFDVPYAFKIFSILEAKRLGYKNCLWLDSIFIPQRGLDDIFDHIEKKGVFFMAYPRFSTRGLIQEFATQAFGVSLSEFLKMTFVQSSCIGFNFTNETALNLLDQWFELTKHRVGFLSHIPELAPLMMLINRFNLLHLAGEHDLISSRDIVNPKTILIWERGSLNFAQ